MSDKSNHQTLDRGPAVITPRAALDALSELGWDTLAVWECELRNESAVRKRLSDFLCS